MPRITDIYTIAVPQKTALIIQRSVTGSGLPQFIGEQFSKLSKYLDENSITPLEAPFLQIAQEQSEMVKAAVGVAVPAGTKGTEEVIRETIIPAGKSIFCYYQGSNDEMNPCYEEMASYAEKNSLVLTGNIYEYYLNGIEFGKEKLLTKIVMDIK